MFDDASPAIPSLQKRPSVSVQKHNNLWKIVFLLTHPPRIFPARQLRYSLAEGSMPCVWELGNLEIGICENLNLRNVDPKLNCELALIRPESPLDCYAFDTIRVSARSVESQRASPKALFAQIIHDALNQGR